jgi:hypothetical protein
MTRIEIFVQSGSAVQVGIREVERGIVLERRGGGHDESLSLTWDEAKMCSHMLAARIALAEERAL